MQFLFSHGKMLVNRCMLFAGAARAVDHNRLVHLTWLLATANSVGLYIERFPSKLNVADGPSRPDGVIGDSIVRDMGAKWCDPWLPREI